jgi:hypothetical protein
LIWYGEFIQQGEMKQRLASQRPRVWNRKNLPNSIERFEDSPRPTKELVRELPAAALGVVRRRKGIALLGVTLVVAGLWWMFACRD